ncbi:aquaporin [archaeon]|nr:aquaporin [archaeon]
MVAKTSYGKYLAELVGTFALVLVGTSVASLAGVFNIGLGQSWLLVSFAFGFTLLAVVYAIGPVSGAHVNPAVTIAMAAAGRIKKNEIAPYIVAQLAGAIAASGFLLTILSSIPGYSVGVYGLGANGTAIISTANTVAPVSTSTLFLLEFVLTALFVFAIFRVTQQKSEHAGLAIGTALFFIHLVGVPLGSASVNPARSIGPALLQGGLAMNNLWIFIVAPILGGLAGWYLYRLVEEY